MDNLEVNKAIASILVAGIAFMVAGFVGEIIVHPHELKKQAIEIAGAPAETAPAVHTQVPKAPPIMPLLASADVAKGKALVEQDCTICHTFNSGGGTKVGPNLYGVVGRPRGSKPGFDYTEGLRKLGGRWTYANLDQWLYDPQAIVPGTRMAFPGIKSTKPRADVIAYLRTLSAHPLALPTAEEIKAAEQTAAAEKAGALKAAASPPAAAQQPGVKAGPPEASFVALVAKSAPAKGEKIVETDCAICHNFKPGQGPKIGPDLFGVVDRPRASKKDFDYSAGLKKLGGKWTYANLNQWLTNPMAVVPGTKMMFPGIKSEKQRAEVVAWLRTLSDHPEPLPVAAAAPAPAAPKTAPSEAAPTPPAAKHAAAETAPPAHPSFDALVAHGNADKGKQIAETDCAICHNFAKGQGTKLGPDLWDVLGRPRASVPGFDYSAGLKKLGGKWTYDHLNVWLTNPMALVPDTKMMFPGIKSEKQRANVVAWLRTLSDHPEKLPAASALAPAAARAPAPAAPEAKKPAAQQGSTSVPFKHTEEVTGAPVATSGTEVGPATGGTRQENPAEVASPGGSGLAGQSPQSGILNAPHPALKQP